MPLLTSRVVHKECGKISDIGRQIADAHRARPKQFVNFFCHHCKAQRPTAEFDFEVDGVAQPAPEVEAPANAEATIEETPAVQTPVE